MPDDKIQPVDRAVVIAAKPYICGVVALLVKLRNPILEPKHAFDSAEALFSEFERRYL
jgi:hypothetical protein